MPDTIVLPPPSGFCDSPSTSGSSSLATLSSPTTINTSTKSDNKDINGTKSTSHNHHRPIALGDHKREGNQLNNNNNNNNSSSSVNLKSPPPIPIPNPTSPSVLTPLSLVSTPVTESFPNSPVTQEDKELDGRTASFSSNKKQEGVPPVVTSYYSTLALRQIKNLSNARPPPSATLGGSTSVKNSEIQNSSHNNNSSGGGHSNRASISLTSTHPLLSLANLARAVSGSTTNSPNSTSPSTPPPITRKKTLSSRRQSDGALLKSSSSDNLESLNSEGQADKYYRNTATLTLEEVLETTGNHSNAVALDPSQITEPNMHQSSSRLLRMTQDDRPFTRDFKDLFSTLMVSLPLTPHRLRFKTYYYTFTSDEAVNNLGSLKFSQSNRMPDPKDPSRIVTTTTTTTFSMAKEMARTVCQKFVAARFMEAVAEKPTTPFTTKNVLWQLTPKGIHVLERFCQRNGINSPHVMSLLSSPLNTMRLVILERDPVTDKVSQDKSTIEIIFRRFAGSTPNVKQNTNVSDSDSISEYADGTTGVRIAESRKVFDKVIKYSLTGKAAVDWLLDCCTTIEPTETHEIAALFLRYNLLQCVVEDKIYIQQVPKAKDFQPTKSSIYLVTERGKRVAGWIDSERGSIENGKPRDGPQNGFGSTVLATQSSKSARARARGEIGENRETNTTRLSCILADPALRLLFREFLRETLCEENLSFWLDVQNFRLQFKSLNEKTFENIRETLASAYGIYNAFLAPGSPCELNIDFTLRQDLAGRMTRAVAKDEQAMYASLKEVAALFERAQEQVFKLMAGDSVPKFAKTARYIDISGDNVSDDGSPNDTPPPDRTKRLAK